MREIAKTKKYDFIFDKSADIVMLYSNKRYDISEQILRTILRSNNQDQVDSRREKKKLEQESIISNADIEDPKKDELEKKNIEAETKRNEMLAIKEAKKVEAETKRNELLAIKEAKKVEAEEKRKKLIEERELKKIAASERARKLIEEREIEKNRIKEEKKKKIEERKKLLEEKKKKILEDRKAELDYKNKSKDSTFTNN